MRVKNAIVPAVRFSSRGSVWSFEGGVMLSSLLELAGRTIWSDLGKCPKSPTGQTLRGFRSTFWPGDLFGPNVGSRKTYFCDEMILW